MRKTSSFWVVFFGLLFGLSLAHSFSIAGLIKTPAEEARYTQYSQHEDIARFLSVLDFESPELTVRVIGKTKDAKNFPSKDLFLVIITEEGVCSPEKLNRQKPTILVTASQHGNEQSAKEAALWLVRDLACGEAKPLLERANFLVIPQANPYGNGLDVRENEQDLNLNRDHVKLESEEARSIHAVFRRWMPEVTMDIHEAGDRYYRINIGCVSNVNIHPRLLAFSRETILAEVEKSLEKEHIPFHEYLVTEEMGIDTASGARLRPEDLAGREELKRYSTPDLNDGRNSLGIYESLSFIQEGASRHDLATLGQRTRWQYFGLRAFVESVAAHGEDVVALVRGLRQDLVDQARTFSEDRRVHLRMEYVRDDHQPTLTIKDFEKTDSPVVGLLKADKKAGEALTEDDLAPYPYPKEYKVKAETIKNWFPRVEPTLSVARPLGYVIPAAHQDVIETLLDHGLEVAIFARDMRLEVEAYLAGEVIPSKYDYLPPEKIEVEKIDIEAVIKKGDAFASCAQAGANLIPCLLEPQSQYGLIRYWSLRLVPEKGNIYAFYRLVRPADLPLIPYRNW